MRIMKEPTKNVGFGFEDIVLEAMNADLHIKQPQLADMTCNALIGLTANFSILMPSLVDFKNFAEMLHVLLLIF